MFHDFCLVDPVCIHRRRLRRRAVDRLDASRSRSCAAIRRVLPDPKRWRVIGPPSLPCSSRLDEPAAELAARAEYAQTSTQAAGPSSLLAGPSGRFHGRCGGLRPGLGQGNRIGFLNAHEDFQRRERGAQKPARGYLKMTEVTLFELTQNGWTVWFCAMGLWTIMQALVNLARTVRDDQ